MSNTINDRANAHFSSFYNSPIIKTFELTEDFCSDGSYFGPLVWELNLKPGEIQKSEDKHGRRILVVGTRFGNVVVFDRYAGQDRGEKVATFVKNNSNDLFLRNTLKAGSQGADELYFILGSTPGGQWNIGYEVETVIKYYSITDETIASQRKVWG